MRIVTLNSNASEKGAKNFKRTLIELNSKIACGIFLEVTSLILMKRKCR